MKIGDNEITLIKGDITKLETECIVNAANKSLLGGGGVDGAIHKGAGKQLYEACLKLGGCNTGEAKITSGYKLKSKYIIHTVGPIYCGSLSDKENLAKCYKNSLNLALEKGIKSIAFPCISTGVYGYPQDEAAEIVMKTLSKWCDKNKKCGIKIIICCYNQTSFSYYKAYFE